jgi:hypothetical protein
LKEPPGRPQLAQYLLIDFKTKLPQAMKEEDILFQQFVSRVARIFKQLRKQKGLPSYESFAFEHDFPRAQYWRVEDGKSNLTLRTVAKLLAIHNLTIDDFATLLLADEPNKK